MNRTTTAALALLVGVVLVAGGLVKLGFIADFLSKSVVTGFIFGLAISILVGQLPKLFGVSAGAGNVFEQLASLVSRLVSSPVLRWSKKPISCSMTAAKTDSRSRVTMRSPATEKR